VMMLPSNGSPVVVSPTLPYRTGEKSTRLQSRFSLPVYLSDAAKRRKVLLDYRSRLVCDRLQLARIL
jgi:hypothetical protein